ncbi:hypothetical protein S40285_09656, partial [Stachybotrys chlorohalonatus IBT 40285]
MEISKIMLSI